MCAARGSESWCNLRSSVEELDLVTEDGPVLVCVEVKVRRCVRRGIHAVH